MKRRALLAGAAALAVPQMVAAQSAAGTRRIGWLDSFPEDDAWAQRRAAVLREGLAKAGWAAGRNLLIDYRWGAFNPARARSAVAELLSSRPDVLICGGTPSALAAQAATATVPIVFAIVSEPVAQGLVPSLSQPGGNVTGFSYQEPTIGAKWLELLKEMVPPLTRAAFVFNPDSSPYSQLFFDSIAAAGPKLGVRTTAAPIQDFQEAEGILSAVSREPGGGTIFTADSFIYTNRGRLIDLTARLRLPAIYGIPMSARDGGLAVYSVDVVEQYQAAAGYVARLLAGERAGNLPIQQPTKFNLGINLLTASSLGLALPPAILSAANEVIE